MKFAIVVGHEAKAPGAHAVAPLDCYEYEYNKGLAALVACALMDRGIQSEIFFRDNVGIHGAYAEVNAYAPDGAIELHFNASGLGTARGTETLYVPRILGSARLADVVHAAICLGLGRVGPLNRGVKSIDVTDRGYGNLTAATCPQILIEPFFGDDSQDAILGLTQKQALANAIAIGIAAFLREQHV